MAGLGHLAKRFFGSLLPLGPRRADAAWALEHLTPGEQALWARMSKVDRRHAAGVARRASATLADQATREVVADALLHDVGKVESRLGTFARVAATVVAAAAGRERAEAWAGGRGVQRRIAVYLRHPELGAELLRGAGSDPVTVAWAAEHHLPEVRWTLPRNVATALKAADDD